MTLPTGGGAEGGGGGAGAPPPPPSPPSPNKVEAALLEGAGVLCAGAGHELKPWVLVVPLGRSLQSFPFLLALTFEG